jgi:RNA polymerase sigma-70 factor, ECF subfamily
VTACSPSFRTCAFAISFCGNVGRADDFVQETLLRALANINSFQPGTNLHSWLFTILCNLVRSDYQKRRHEVEDTDGGYPDNLKSPPEQRGRLELEEVRVALTKLPSTQREHCFSLARWASRTRRRLRSAKRP